MPGWTKHHASATALPLSNVDTDQLIPARFMSQPRSKGYGDFLFHDLRRDADGFEDPGFPLNKHPDTGILVAGNNFGSGSSREAAVYALVDAGIKAVVAPSFSEIFARNAVNNGLLPAQVPEDAVTTLFDAIGQKTLPAEICLDTCRIAILDLMIPFELDEGWRTKLRNGWDDIDLTLQYQVEIARHKEQAIRNSSWVWPGAGL